MDGRYPNTPETTFCEKGNDYMIFRNSEKKQPYPRKDHDTD